MEAVGEFILYAMGVLGFISFIEQIRLKKRLDILESMLAWKNIMSLDETRWVNLPDAVKKLVKDMSN